MPFKWDAESERALLLMVIAEMSPPMTAIWPNVAERLGRGLSDSACSQKFYKLKKEAEKILGTDGPGTATTPKTPTAKADKATPRKTTGGGKRKKADSGEDVEETPTKKKKATVKVEVKSEPDANDSKQAKVEDVEDDESGL
ncbi:hypothetical protein LTS15_002416 [Exophiala xenobiotica]|nr:hypothetical protein LTS15_002416 [Exophiala xenobiotica]